MRVERISRRLPGDNSKNKASVPMNHSADDPADISIRLIAPTATLQLRRMRSDGQRLLEQINQLLADHPGDIDVRCMKLARTKLEEALMWAERSLPD